MLSLITGILLLSAGGLRAGWIADLLSVPVTVGFLTGIAVHIIVGQLLLILGIAPADDSIVAQARQLINDLPHANATDASNRRRSHRAHGQVGAGERETARPVHRARGCGICRFRCTFTNALYVVARLERFIAVASTTVKLVVIECSGVLDIDYSGARTIIAAIARLRRKQIDVVPARLDSERAPRSAIRTGVIAAVGSTHVFKTIYDAVSAFGYGGSAV